jgi:hypothetical protein
MAMPDIRKNVESRAAALLEHHMSLLGGGLGGFDGGGMSYARADEGAGVSSAIGYGRRDRFMTRTYDLSFSVRIEGADLGDSFKARLKFRGMRQIETGFFDIRPEHAEAERIFNDPRLIERIVGASRQVDIATVTAEYSAGTETLTVKVVPYAGAFLWVKMPPVYYPLKLRADEMRALVDLLGQIEDYLRKTARK